MPHLPWLRNGRFWSYLLAAGVVIAIGCSASGNSSPYSGGGNGAGTTGGAGGELPDGESPDGDLDVSAGTGGSGTGGSSGSGTGGLGTGGLGTGGLPGSGGLGGGGTGGGGTGGGGLDAGGAAGWDNCVPKTPPTGGPPAATDVIMSGAPADSSTKFGGTDDPSRAPELVYPPDGTMMPPNIATLDVQFLPGTGNDLFEVSFLSNTVNLRIYTKCSAVSGGCGLKVDGITFADQIAKKAAGYDPMTITVRGVSSASPGSVGASPTRSLSIAQEFLLGGIYYWDAGGQVVRYDFGHPTAQGESYYTQANGGAMCVGCHTLSAPGNLMAVGLNIPGPATLRVIEVASKNQRFQLAGGDGSNFQAFSPNEEELITSNGARLVWRNAFNGNAAAPNPLVAKGTMPDYHPDTTMIVFARPGGMAFASPGIDNGSLYLLARNNNLTWGGETLLVPASNSDENNYYPAFSPDGSLVMFNRSAAYGSYLAPDSMVYVVPTAGGTPIGLTKANLSDQVGNSWPKWAPFKTCDRGRKLLWYTVSSARDYGLRIKNPPMPSDPDAGDPRRWQVWMAAFDVEKALNGEDPSYPAFWVPFQSMSTGNHIAQWTKKVVRHPCLTDNDCNLAKEKCDANECVPK